MMFLFNILLLFELCSFQILGNAGLCLQQEFYTVEGLAQELAGSAFVTLDHVPDHRLRLMIHILCLFNWVFVFWHRLLCSLLTHLFIALFTFELMLL